MSREDVLQDGYSRMQRLREQSRGLLDFRVVESARFPVTYVVELHCKGVRVRDGEVTEINRHQVAINLGPDYPIKPPDLMWCTPILHPNILAPGVCLLGGWGAKTRLDEVCLWLWDMARYRLYNLKDPLDKPAAEWAKQYESVFPLDQNDLRAVVGTRSRELTDAEIGQLIKIIPPEAHQ